MSKTLAIYGAGGTGRGILDQIRRAESIKSTCDELIYIDDILQTDTVYGIKRINWESMTQLYAKDEIGIVISFGDPAIREQIWGKVVRAGFHVVSYILPEAFVSSSVKIGEGCLIAKCYIDNNVTIGDNVFVFPEAIIGHDVLIGDNSIVSARSFIGGHSILGKNVYYGPCAACRDRISIGEGAIVGLNAAVYKDVPSGFTAVGNPAHNLPRAEKRIFAK